MAATFRALQAIRSGCAHYGIGLPRAAASAISLYATGRFSLKEIAGYALYAPHVRRTIPVLISKERSLAKLARLNPPGHQDKTEDKQKFHEICSAAGLPVPEYYGVFEGGHGMDGTGIRMHGKEAWSAYFGAQLPAQFVIKEQHGAYGSGFAAFDRKGGQFAQVGGATFDAGGLVDELTRRAPSAFIFQERLFDHPDLTVLSGRRGLQTLRVNTLAEEGGSVRILFYMIKILVGTNVSDNFAMGTTGNLIAIGNSDDGILTGARTLHPCGSGLKTIHRHPETGIAFEGFRIPLWREAIELAKSAHRSFPELGTLGWDIALTPQGPKLIEANAWWDPPAYAPNIMSTDNWAAVFS